MREQIEDTIAIGKFIVAVAEADAPMALKYDLIFGRGVSSAIQCRYDLGRLYGYYDPDTSHEEDVLAFASACKKLVCDLEAVLEKLDEK